MKIRKLLYVAAEISPYANAGGLGEVGKSFPKALRKSSAYEVERVMPYHKSVKGVMKYHMDYTVALEQGYETCIVKTDGRDTDIVTYFIANDRYFYRDNLYGYEDDGVRYFFFCKAVLELIKRMDHKPEIVHTNDWHTGMLTLMIKKEFPEIKTVYTIHNISYHGYIPASYLAGLISIKEQYTLGWPEWLNFMKAGILYSDLLTTVSPGYCEEIKKPEHGCGMTPLIEGRQQPMIGILNGIDMQDYDPTANGDLEFTYDSLHIEQKRNNRTWLREHYKLPEDERPLVAMVTRLDYSKGIDILLNAISYFDFTKFQLIILGSGNPHYQGLLAGITYGYPESIAVDFVYSVDMAKKIYAGADIYLMPSLFEPCGLGQLYAMRYGAVPIVHPVGGLKDTIIDLPEQPERSSGFYMREWSGQALNEALNRALKVYHSTDWSCLIENGMDFDSSWERSVAQYLELYEVL
ncbi:MAG: glycogen synthase [Herbinix sp.]|jgi:starch synthase|nr:glycogen synthase [Herbinix sp.]